MMVAHTSGSIQIKSVVVYGINQNVLDLRQNLEDTMSSLRGSQLSHRYASPGVLPDIDPTGSSCYFDRLSIVVQTAPFRCSVTSLPATPGFPRHLFFLRWRHGQSSPRLQAGDAPSYPATYTAHTMPARCPPAGRLGSSSTSRIELIEGLDDGDLKSGYLSDSNLPDDDDQLANGWDESSSISSGLSDGDGEVSDNLSSEEFNVSSSLNSLPTTPLGSRRNSSVMLRTDAEKRSLVESGLSWYSEVSCKSGRKLDPGTGSGSGVGSGSGAYETGSLKTEAPSKWRKKPPPLPQHQSASEDCMTGSLAGVRGGEAPGARKPQSLGGQSGSLKKGGRNPPVGVTSPITHTSQSMLKVAGEH
ncbi:hypothetical protein CRUP_007352 [Coryphaenoides rupestris]|nr:hypothetical protein CRUP_007352 [Coryphaenoides rupestris]